MGKEWEHYSFVQAIMDRLDEKDLSAFQQFDMAVIVLGRERILAILKETLEIEMNGGMNVSDGSRRRTPGGVFLRLVKGQCSSRQRIRIWPEIGDAYKAVSRAKRQWREQDQRRIESTINREDCVEVLTTAEEKGYANTVKITLIGRLGKFIDKGTYTVGIIQHEGTKLPSLPKGVPTPSRSIKTNYVVYIGSKQWNKIAEAACDSSDTLIIEGFPQIDPKTGAISVFTSSATSKKLQRAKNEGGK